MKKNVYKTKDELTLQSISEKIFFPFVCVIVSICYFILTYKLYSTRNNDMAGHIKLAEDFFSGNGDAASYFLYLCWFVIKKMTRTSSRYAMAYAMAFFSFLCTITTYYIVSYVLKDEDDLFKREKAIIPLFLSFMGPLYLGGKSYYLGNLSFNAWHNPTHTSVKFLALLIFFLYFSWYYNYRTDKQTTNKYFTIKISILLFLSCFFKLSFAQVFIPTVAIVVAVDFFNRKISFKTALSQFMIVFPSVLYVLWMITKIWFINNLDPNLQCGIEIAPFAIWARKASSIVQVCFIVLKTILLSLAFPLFVFLYKGQKSKLFYVSFLFVLIAIIEAAFFAETGYRRMHGNFFWGTNLAVGIVFLSAILQFVKDVIRNNNRIIIKLVGFCLLIFHFAFGIWYYYTLLTGNRQCW